jgi:putative membrane protein
MEDQMNGNMQLRTFACVALGALLLGACDRGDRETAMAELDTAYDTARARIDTAVGRLGREYTDAELTGFVNAFNDAEIEVGQLAMSRATDPEVKTFASHIVRDYQALKADVNRTAQQLNLNPMVPEDDEGLRKDHEDGLSSLRAKASGEAFDEAFAEHEIRMHRKVLDEVRDALNRTQEPQMRTLLEKARTTLEGHLEQAEKLEKKFGA